MAPPVASPVASLLTRRVDAAAVRHNVRAMSESQIGEPTPSETVADSVEVGRALFERALQRRIKGLDYFPSLAPPDGASARDQLIANGVLNLYRYRPLAYRVHRVPVLLVMATSSRGYAADLVKGASLVEHLLKAGFDVFMAEWTAPQPDENYLKFENYILDFLPRCASRVRKESGTDELSVIGYRSGGLLALLWAALNPDRGARNLVCMATPYDYAKLDIFQTWADRSFFDVDKMVDRFGSCPTDMLDAVFELMGTRPDAAGEAGLWDRLWGNEQRDALHMFTRWMGDLLPQAGEYFRQHIKRLVWENRLMHGSLEVGGRRIEPARITASFLQIVAEQDVLVPPESSRPLFGAIGSKDRQEIVVRGGHADLFLGREARTVLWPALAAWLGERSA